MTTWKATLMRRILAVLSPAMDVLELRGADEGAREGGDLDLLVPSGRALDACSLLADALAQEGLYVIAFRDIGYIAQVVILRRGTGQAGDIATKVDVWNGLHWRGLGSDPFGAALLRARREGCLADGPAAALATLLQKFITSGTLSDRDRARVFGAELDAVTIASFCSAAGVPLVRTEIEGGRIGRAAKWRLRAASADVHGGVNAVHWAIQVARASLTFRSSLTTGAGIALGVAGMDGSGKTTLVERFCRALEASEMTAPVVVHLLPDVIPTPHRLFGRTKTVANYSRPYAEPPVQSRLSGWLRLGYYMAAFAAARVWCATKVARGQYVVFDRSIVDFASDLARARIPHVKLPGQLICALMPSRLFFYLAASPATVVARKGELTPERATQLAERYGSTADLVGIARLDGNQAADVVFADLVAAVSQAVVARIHRHACRQD